MRFALFSDVHGNLAALRAVQAALEREGPFDRVVVAGDHLQGGPRPREVWELLNRHGWILLRGNEDEALVAGAAAEFQGREEYRAAFLAGNAWTRSQLAPNALDQLAVLPVRWRTSTPVGDLLVCHASPRSTSDRAGASHNTSAEVFEAYGGTGAAVIAFGHYHRHSVRSTPFAILVNVASVGLPTHGLPLASYTILTTVEDGWFIEQRQAPYDAHEEAIAAARRRMPQWVPEPPTAPPD
jgi:predicted phosphodiesterase